MRAACWTPDITAEGVHPEFTASWQDRMKALSSEATTSGPKGLTTSEGDLEHPIEDREALHRVLRRIQTSRGRAEEVEPGWTCPGQWKGQETESGWDGRDDNEVRGLTTPEKRKENSRQR